ncbi:HTH tetR-type domain-containing protein [Bordetella sputigena]|uniref:TetR/AcrR family transcriptional regulator n=1 Tax=Bordetella sputigena TaxID=1416810 RepID=UPI0039F0005D
MSTTTGGATRKRVRLQPEVRKDQILDAALAEFGAHGFAATTVDRIAARAQLSKAGVYAHFASKDEIFETLLMRMLTPSFPARNWCPGPDRTVEEIVDAYIDDTYAKFRDPQVAAVLRLLIAESGRLPHLVRRWRTEVVQSYLDEQQRMIRRLVAEGRIRSSPLTDYFDIVTSPMVQGWVMYFIFGDDFARRDLKKLKEAHRRLLADMLKIS